MQAILSFLTEIFSQPAFLMGLIAFVGLVALRSPGNKLLTGTLKPILGYLMLSAGAGVIVANLNPLGGIIEAGFNIRGVIPNNEAIVSVDAGRGNHEYFTVRLYFQPDYRPLYQV